MRKALPIILFLSLISVLKAQDIAIDSLTSLIEKHVQEDTTRINLLNELASISVLNNHMNQIITISQT